MSRFFIEDVPSLAERLIAHFERIRKSLESASSLNVESLILGGGYGRGEGGIYRDSDGTPHFYNDLDYFLFASNPEDTSLREWVARIERSESETLGIDVEIQCLPPGAIQNPSESMMFYDLVAGHEVVYGPEDYLEPFEDNLDPSKIKIEEATRLLWNRGSGLYFAAKALRQTQPDLAFAHRNIQKCKLALGDAILAARGLYHVSAKERGRRLRRLEKDIDPRIAPNHAEGLEFKLRPTAAPKEIEEVLANHRSVCALWKNSFLQVERRRLGITFKSLLEYAQYPGRLYPKQPKWRCLILAFRDRLKRGGMLRPITDYPRGALMRSLASLLSDGPIDTKRAVLSKYLQRDNANDPDHDSWKDAYERWWNSYS